MPIRYKLPQIVTGSTWGNVADSLWSRLPSSEEGAPQISNREALAIVLAVRAESRVATWPLWYQFAALAYGWSPESDGLNTTVVQADDQYPDDDAALLTAEVRRILDDLDAAGVKTPKLSLIDRWGSVDVQSSISDALRQDGASAQFKIPIPACKDPVTGKPAKPVYDRTQNKWVCPGGMVTIDDPITAIVKSLQTLVLPVAVILIAAAAFDGKRRRR